MSALALRIYIAEVLSLLMNDGQSAYRMVPVRRSCIVPDIVLLRSHISDAEEDSPSCRGTRGAG